MTQTFTSLEHVIRRAPLGLRFSDMLSGAQVFDGLQVWAYALDTKAAQLTLAQSTREQLAQHSALSGIYGFNSLFGLADYALALKGVSDYWVKDGQNKPDLAHTPPNYVITVRDTVNRFLPLVSTRVLPVNTIQDVALFSNPLRGISDNYGVIRLELWDAKAKREAAWALVEVTGATANDLHFAMADEKGKAAIYIPYPPPNQSPDFGSDPPRDLTWPYQLRVFYKESKHQRVQGLDTHWPPTINSLLPPMIEPVQGQWEIDDQEQPPTPIVIKDADNPADRITVTAMAVHLQYRAETVLRTIKLVDNTAVNLAQLWIEPAA